MIIAPLLGIIVLAYIVYLVIGVGIAIAMFFGLLLIVFPILISLAHTNRMLEALHHQGAADFGDLYRAINRINK